MPDTRSYPYDPKSRSRSMPLVEDVLAFLPGTGDVLAAKDAVEALKKGDYTGAALSALGVLPFIPGTVTTGIRKGRPLFHGTRNDEKAASNILKEGYTRGSSAELRVPGTSLAANPAVSMFKFGGHPEKSLLINKLPPDVPVRNLRPSEYATMFLEGGGTLSDIKRTHVVGTPRSYFDETEVFVPEHLRNKISPRRPTSQEATSLMHEFGRGTAIFKAHDVALEAAKKGAFLPGSPIAEIAKKSVPDSLGMFIGYYRMRHPRVGELKSDLLRYGSDIVKENLKYGLPAINDHPVFKRAKKEYMALYASLDKLEKFHRRNQELNSHLRRFVRTVEDAEGNKYPRLVLGSPADKQEYQRLRREVDTSYKKLRSMINDVADKYEAFIQRLPESLISSPELRKKERQVMRRERRLPEVSFFRSR